ncbi:ABC transporter G family member 23-like [Nilaparvata lugens]|uniref:ABC transporter G family member 23-like n=1 Tax=Nilaparvata lugens TaxID=108931 RepID=UPI00193D1071|nr:ABC transporter G family member 23-like [Nilaparvata lugens]
MGYMPQEVSLYEEFQIHEVFRYFGLLTNQTEDYIKHREKELAELLDLPPTNRLVCNLSGGQQRRVSMAVALFHNPKFLILDEPTVGLDPLLCESIWKYFIHITDVEHKTIIITTHYIEEARNSHTIGLMRGGILLTERSPLQLMEMNNCSSLEEAFLKLSQKQEDIPSDSVCS